MGRTRRGSTQGTAPRVCLRSSGTVVTRGCYDANDVGGAVPSVPLDPQVYVDHAEALVDQVLNDPVVHCLLGNPCPL